MHVECFNHDGEPILYDATLLIAISDDGNDTDNSTIPPLGDHVEIIWRFDDHCYPGTVSRINGKGQHFIAYDIGDVDTLNMASETLYSCSIFIATSSAAFPALDSDSPLVIRQMFDI